MKKMSQTGFSVVEALLILIIVAIVAGTGWYVWHVQQNTNKLADDSVKQSQPANVSLGPTYTDDSAKGTVHYHNALGKFRLDYPASWVHQNDNDPACKDANTRDLEIGPNNASVALCGKDGTVSQVQVISLKGNQTNSGVVLLKGHPKGWTDLQTSTVTADGITGTFYCGTAKGQVQGIGSYPDDAYVYENVWYTNGNTYIATYTQYPKSSKTGPTMDEDAVFNKIIASLKFE